MMRQLMVMGLAALLLSGCGAFSPRETPTVASYQLTKTAVKRYPGRRSSRVLYVMQTTASPGYQSAKMIYTQQSEPYRLKTFSRNRWISPPAYMLAPLITESLSNSRRFKAVVMSPYAGMSDVILYTKLVRVQQEFNGEQSQVRLSLLATLVDSRTHSVIRTREFTQVLSAPEANPKAGVIAFNDALQMVLNRLVKFAIV